MVKAIILLIVGGVLLAWGLTQTDIIGQAFSFLIAIINVQIVGLFVSIYNLFTSYSYLLMFLFLFIICWIIVKFVEWIKR